MKASGNTQLDTQVREWKKPVVKYVGNVADVVKGGGGKLSTVGGDPGEMRKQMPAG